MPDVRENIMARLATVVAGVSGVAKSYRNVVIVDETQLPAVSVLEGDEEVSDGGVAHSRTSNRPSIVTASPLVMIRVQSGAPGSAFNDLRAKVIKAVLEDATLNDLVLNRRGIRFTGMSTNEFAARQIVGAGTLQFTLTYALDPNEL